MDGGVYDTREVRCSECGETFRRSGEYVFGSCCSYTCYRKAYHRNEEKRKEREALMKEQRRKRLRRPILVRINQAERMIASFSLKLQQAKSPKGVAYAKERLAVHKENLKKAYQDLKELEEYMHDADTDS